MMKKLFFTMVFVAAAFFCNAQLFVGGNIGLGTTANKVTMGSETNEGPKSFTFYFNPSVGYMFNDNIGAGIVLGFSTITVKEKELNEELKGTLNSFSVSPYFRYVFANFGDIDLYADAMFTYSYAKTKGNAANTTVDINKTNTWGVSVVPGISYSLTDNILFYSNLNLLQLGYQSIKETEFGDVTDLDVETIDNNFYFGVNNNSPITLGIIYVF